MRKYIIHAYIINYNYNGFASRTVFHVEATSEDTAKETLRNHFRRIGKSTTVISIREE